MDSTRRTAPVAGLFYLITFAASIPAVFLLVTSRVMEPAIIVVGVVSLLAVVTLRRDLAGAPSTDTAALVTTGRALVAVRDWTFLRELSLGVWLVVKGFRPSPITAGMAGPKVAP